MKQRKMEALHQVSQDHVASEVVLVGRQVAYVCCANKASRGFGMSLAKWTSNGSSERTTQKPIQDIWEGVCKNSDHREMEEEAGE